MVKVALYFEDEAPRIGCGWRLVKVLKIGRKWVRLEAAASGRRVKLPRHIYEVIAASARPGKPRARKRG